MFSNHRRLHNALTVDDCAKAQRPGSLARPFTTAPQSNWAITPPSRSFSKVTTMHRGASNCRKQRHAARCPLPGTTALQFQSVAVDESRISLVCSLRCDSISDCQAHLFKSVNGNSIKISLFLLLELFLKQFFYKLVYQISSLK